FPPECCRFAIMRTRSAIIGSLLLLVMAHCNGLQYQPFDSYANGEECALILDARGRTSVYDYTYNLLRGSFSAAGGAQTCITYDAVNHAYVEARKRINVARPKSEVWRPEDLATVGELLLDITTNLAQTYGLTYEEIQRSLPLIDTSKTLIHEVCPAFLSNIECRPGKYRRFDGLCTNLQNPNWGASLSPFTRLIGPQFADGLTAPRISITGRNLPLSRVVSRTMHPDEGYHDHAGTVMVIAWGQFMDHDYTLTATPLDPLNRNDPEECCGRPPHLKNPYCNEILIPEDDYFYRLFNVQCMDFVRAFPAVRPGCRLGSRVPFNLLTGVLDGNTVYGITDAFARKLRSGYGGLLRMNPVFSEYGLKDLLPLKLDIPDEGCTRPNRSMYCFEAGEIRVNEQLVLTCMHTLMAREHNRLAKALAIVNPHWDDEILFQEARRIVIAEIQHITYNEFLPILLGKDVMEKFGLLLEKEKYWDGYDSSVNPGVIDAFAAAAFRFGHSLLPTAVERWSKAHKFIASKRLSDLIRRPYDLYRAGVFDEYFMGLMNQVAQAMDDSITQEVTNHLFKKAGAKFGLDLVSFNMQRGREFGIPSYMEFRKYCGLPEANVFDELFGSMPNETVRRYSTIFEHPADVDLWSGGVSERPLPGSMLGPTFACLIATQFSHSRRGDRFWYELPNQPSSFTLEQLNEIRKTKLARVICDNTDLIDSIQIYPMVLPDHEINPRVPCRSGILPSIDLSKWAEFPATSHASQYNTIMGSMQATSETEPAPEQVYVNKFNRKLRKLKSVKNAGNLKKNPKPWWINPYAKRKGTTRHFKVPQKILRRKEFLNQQITLPTFTPINRNENMERSSDMEIVKITTVVETIRQKRQSSEQMLKVKKNIQKTISKKRSKRSPYEKLRDNSPGKKNRHNVSQRKAVVSNKKSRRAKPNLRKLARVSSARKQENKITPDLKTANNVAIPSTVFYKRIWEYINGTRPHSDIISDYNSVESDPEGNGSCADQDRTAASQSREDKSRGADIEPERDFYKRIWDIINATHDRANGDAKARTKRDASALENKSSTQLCAQNGTIETTNEEPSLVRNNVNSPESSTPNPYISGFWTVANETQWEPIQIPGTNAEKLRDGPLLSSLVNSASEVDDLNKVSDKAEHVAHSSSNNNDARNSSREIITEPGPPYSSEESFSAVSAIDKGSREEGRAENYSTSTTPRYDPSSIPYVDVPDYSDQREDSLDKSNRSAAAARYKEYDDTDYDLGPKRYHADDFSSKSPNVGIEVGRDESNEHEASINASDSRSSCVNGKDFDKCVDKYDSEGTKLLNNTEDATDDEIYRSAEDSAESASSKEKGNVDSVDFDVNEYKKPFNWDEFFKNDPVLENIRASAQNTSFSKKYGYDEQPDRPEKSDELETRPRERSRDYFPTNEDYRDDRGTDSGEKDETTLSKENDSYAEKETKESEGFDYYPYDDKDFFKHIFEKDNDEESAATVDKENEFLSRYFTEDVLRKLQDNSTTEEDRRREASENKENVQKTLSRILEKKDRFSRLDDNLNKMIEKGEAVPIKYNNFWSLEYESPRRRIEDEEEESEDSNEEA
ncbi:uncharacterized protein Cysu, partial [Cardiocondyla obscurior]|uniref:uncharacterized protein Cysu n=1 Tax=Cardiocondyla obscurior TaxID=286306 RepID=UPI0039656FB8